MIQANTGVRSARVRSWLLASAGTVSLILGGTAHAQNIGPSGMINEPQGGAQPISTISDPSIIVSPPNTPASAVDTGVNGVGQMIIDQKNGFIGTCTGTLINPRTVIFAAHCVNENPNGGAMDPWGYGTGANQLPIGFGFQANNNAAGNSAFGKWLNGVSGGQKYLTRVADYMYNVNQVLYHPDSVLLGDGNNFLQADVAVASLDTPAANVPTWALLLSELPAPGAIDDVTGTGYHVTVTGYGNNGVGPTGATGSDFRRRVAENYVGILGSLDDVDLFLFGSAGGLPQNLYQVDFDSPGHGNQFDFNAFKDDALPNEGITGPGDSGGPLIVDRAFAKQVVIAVLSGGSRYFNGQPGSSYGTTSFYQPLYLFWDYLAASNPYRYVGAKAGDGAWTDPNHWVTKLDPAYNVLVNGQLVNGIPTTPGEGINGTGGKFGQICFLTDCVDIANAPSSSTTPLPAATLANGLPGASNFVPNNIDPNAATQTNARYFDVTLSAAGTTTLDSAVTIDRFTMTSADAKLNVGTGGSLKSLININQLDGLVTNNGLITSVGDYFLLSGGVTGSGRFNAPYFTSATGIFAPGTTGTAGTLTFGGNLVLSSGTHYFIDLGSNGVSDKIAVVATTFNGATPTNGTVSLGGQLGFAIMPNSVIRSTDVYTILTAEGGFADLNRFSPNTSPLSAILGAPRITYTPNAVQVSIDVGKYADLATSPIQRAYAQLLDQNRAGTGQTFVNLYGPLDLQNAGTIRATLEGFAPRAEALNYSIGTVAVDNMARFYRDRLNSLQPGELGGTLALVGQPLKLAALNMNGMLGQPEVRSDAGDTVLQEGKLPETVSGFIAGGYLNGDSSPMPTAVPLGGRNQFDGYYLAAGLETELSEHAVAGFAFSYSKVDGDTAIAGQTARGALYQGTIYGKVESVSGIVLDGVASAGLFATRTERTAAILATTYRLEAKDQSLALSAEIGLGKNFDLGQLKVGPRVSLRASRIGFDRVAETGGGPALVYDRENLDSLQARAGLTASAKGTFRPYLSAYYVHDFANQPAAFGANFVGGVGPNALFAMTGEDNDWAEIGGGIAFGSDKAEFSVGADTTLSRSDVANQSYRASVKLRF
ncbi:autotransporter domain-containing protein [Sphingomonas alpina]|uniref:Autotransporter domain-containing protein n=1 Tax=Sphingomonas alpina TaxID=653931 RepID=A0A7H0LL88_9SPHN|nr:autotransporter domain-containing protein [Sphingomonas alpina]QNQ10441.1 autotransporter domain-containing protein [Sphingomonas alpina]